MISGIVSNGSFLFNLSMQAKADDDELSEDEDEEHGGAEQRSGSHVSGSDEDYFRGVLANSFIAGCSPSQEEMKNAPNNSMYQTVAAQNAALQLAYKETYFDRCKTVGRLGPPKTELDRSSAYGDFVFGHERSEQRGSRSDCPLALDIEAKSSFVSIRANTAVFRDCFYYEVTLLSDGLMQIGWCSRTTNFNHHNGVGDSPNSYAFDGYRVEKWNLDH